MLKKTLSQSLCPILYFVSFLCCWCMYLFILFCMITVTGVWGERGMKLTSCYVLTILYYDCLSLFSCQLFCSLCGWQRPTWRPDQLITPASWPRGLVQYCIECTQSTNSLVMRPVLPVTVCCPRELFTQFRSFVRALAAFISSSCFTLFSIVQLEYCLAYTAPPSVVWSWFTFENLDMAVHCRPKYLDERAIFSLIFS